jgi:hypothetical protein
VDKFEHRRNPWQEKGAWCVADGVSMAGER